MADTREGKSNNKNDRRRHGRVIVITGIVFCHCWYLLVFAGDLVVRLDFVRPILISGKVKLNRVSCLSSSSLRHA